MTQLAVEKESQQNEFTPGIPAHQVTLTPDAPSIGRFARGAGVPTLPTGFNNIPDYLFDVALKGMTTEDTIDQVVEDCNAIMADPDDPYTQQVVDAFRLLICHATEIRVQRSIGERFMARFRAAEHHGA